MSNQEEQPNGSQLLGIMKKNIEAEQEDDESNKFPPNFQSSNSGPFNNNINSENSQSITNQDTEPAYDDFLNVGGDKLISGLNRLNLGNNSSNQTISPKKIESNNFFQNPMKNLNMNNKNNQKDLAFNYYFGNGIQGDLSKKAGESGSQTVSSQILERLGYNNINNENNNDINEQQYKFYFNNQQSDNNNQNDDEKNDNNPQKFSPNIINQNQEGQMMINMNFPNKNINNQKMNLNENMLNQNNNNINKMNIPNINKQMMQMNNNMNNINNLNLGGNIQFNQMDPRIRNIIQQNLMMNNKMMGNNNMIPNSNQMMMNNQNNMQMNNQNNMQMNKNQNNMQMNKNQNNMQMNKNQNKKKKKKK